MVRQILNYGLGFVALGLVCYSLFSKKKSNFLLIQLFANLFYGGAYIAIEAYVAGIITFVSILRCIFLYFAEKKNFKYTYYVLALFILAYIAITVVFWSSWLDIFPLLSASIYAYSHAIKNLQIGRYVMIVPTTISLVYSCLVGAYVNAGTKLIQLVSTIVAIIVVHHQLKKAKAKEETKDSEVVIENIEEKNSIEKTES